ncbi:flotillin domain-containing protein [Sphingomonas sp. PB2P19]|uniref:flotillin domain-containing protein n=1 Tax=Sphingomonas rhamnosi TaxID=3096156 RepID=UPI002FC8940A
MLEALPAIIAAASKPMENIDKISILDARGLRGDGGKEASVGGAGQGNLADAAVAAAMRYCVGSPLIDGLMAELGMTGSSLNGMLAGSGADATAVRASSSDARRNPATLNGGSDNTPT